MSGQRSAAPTGGPRPAGGASTDQGGARTAEHARLAEATGRAEDDLFNANPWYEWGPYLSERAWGTVREDYSDNGDAWNAFPHDQARSRAYRWNEDGMAGISDIHHELCLALALWNGADPILKERMFGLTGPQGNHGEDVKEYWWYLDALPSHAWLRWRYHYPQAAYPYQQLIDENGRRGLDDPEFELLDTGVFDDGRYWIVDVTYAKASPTEILARITIENHGAEPATIDVLPTLWFRNTWRASGTDEIPVLRSDGDAITVEHPDLDGYRFEAAPGPDGHPARRAVLQQRDQHGAPVRIGSDHAVPQGRDQRPRRERRGDRRPGAAGHEGRMALPPQRRGWWSGGAPAPSPPPRSARRRPAAGRIGPGHASTTSCAPVNTMPTSSTPRSRPSTSTPNGCASCVSRAPVSCGASRSTRTACSRWLDGDPAEPPPPPGHRAGRNAGWRHLDAFDVLAMPDPWEYPWFAAWDLAFHSVAWAHLDPAFAKYQLLVLLKEWFLHPNGALPAYEWSFDDVNPPVHALAALRVFVIDGATDLDFLERVFQKLLLNFTWWLNREDPDGNNLFGGGFLGLDNISPVDRSHLPPGMRLDQADGTAWMAYYSVAMLTLANALAAATPSTTTWSSSSSNSSSMVLDALGRLRRSTTSTTGSSTTSCRTRRGTGNRSRCRPWSA